MVWLIRAIINGNIIIQASISKRSHLNEYIFCLGAVAASESLKRKERGEKTTEKSLVQSFGGWGRRIAQPLATGSLKLWAQSKSDPSSLSNPGRDLRARPWARPCLMPVQPGEYITLVWKPLGSDTVVLNSTAYFKINFSYMLHL